MINYKFSREKQKAFATTLQTRVNSYFRDNNITRNATGQMKVKSVVAFCFYTGIYLTIIFSGIHSIPVLFGLWALLGVGQAFIGTSVMHDVLHGSYSKDKRVNQWMTIFPLMVGVEPRTWKIQHNVLHHTYTNIESADEDIEVRPVLRLSEHQPRHWFHRFQHLYVVFFYSIPIIVWATAKDFVKMFKYRRLKLIEGGASFWKAIGGIIFRKSIFHFFLLAVPIMQLPIAAGWVVLMFLTMLVVTGLVLSFVFQTAHLVPDLGILETADPQIEENWMVHQLNTTTNYATDSKLFSWFFGSLNFQVEHHLFPNICHVHYPNLAKIVQQTTKEFGLPYHCQGTFGNAILQHFRLLWRLGRYDKIGAPAIAH